MSKPKKEGIGPDLGNINKTQSVYYQKEFKRADKAYNRRRNQ